MKKQLSSICIEFDPNVKSLKKDAIMQLLIKIVCQQEARVPKSKIWQDYKSIVKCDEASQAMIYSLIDELKGDEVKCKDGLFYVSSAKKNAFMSNRTQEEQRTNDIIRKFFNRTAASPDTIKEWLNDSMIHFFKMYSEEWISDLHYRSQTLLSNKNSILDTIKRRTENNKSLPKEDIPLLINGFSDMLLSRDIDVAAFMWTYGTTQFAAQLIKNSNALDQVTIDTFSGSTCILDTNILMNLGLEGGEYYSALNVIEKAFGKLNIAVKFLYITKEEYERTVHNKSREILSLVDNFERDVLKNTDDQYLQTALKRRCSRKEDFERFFGQLLTPPTVINKTVKVSLLDNDTELVSVVEEAQKDESLVSNYNNCYHSLTGKNKRINALYHDVGLISGVNYLRSKGRYFILSQDTAINRYSKNYPFKDNLPLAIKVDTLLNVLALSSYDNNGSDYITLFADLIRMGLTTHKDKFTSAELSFVMERHQQFSNLPPESVIRISKEVHQMRLDGEEDETINKKVIRLIQGEKIGIKEDLDATKRELSIERKNKDAALSQAQLTQSILEDEWRNQSYNKTDTKIKWYWVCSAVFPILLVGLIFYFESINLWIKSIPDLYASFVLDAIVSVLLFFFGFYPKIKHLKGDREAIAQQYIDSQKQKYKS